MVIEYRQGADQNADGLSHQAWRFNETTTLVDPRTETPLMVDRLPFR